MDFVTLLGILGVVFGGISLIMAVPSCFQMFYGRPDFEINFVDFQGSEGKTLLISIKNRPIIQRWLNAIGVIRETGDVLAYFDIRELGTNKYIEKDCSALLHNSATREDALMIRAMVGFTVGINIIHFSNGKAYIVNARAKKLKEIPEGDYAVDAQIICGQKVYKSTRNFKISNEAHKVSWC